MQGEGGRGKVEGEGEEQKYACLKRLPPTPPPRYKFISHPCLPLPLKAKMVALIFCQENTELWLTKITPAPQDSVVKEYMRLH